MTKLTRWDAMILQLRSTNHKQQPPINSLSALKTCCKPIHARNKRIQQVTPWMSICWNLKKINSYKNQFLNCLECLLICKSNNVILLCLKDAKVGEISTIFVFISLTAFTICKPDLPSTSVAVSPLGQTIICFEN